ncbi:MAG: efflux RND transporter periplasmic adaptor subunit [Deltaproteobacteria bacterium]|jgi:RND family efflux transporter MFP subunit|nr:efflux RND transporter periplasmic adaptor subunit [Deltaproteobacteria bacterium]MBW2440596.1 efflux RND transporter periplasmic adaptor subunit [Deltaproteobacteria bacterium]
MKKGATFKTIRVFVVILVAIIIAAALVILRPKAERRVVEDRGRLVEVFAARAEKVQMVIEAYGTVKPRDELLLVAEVRGQVTATDPTFEEGNFVTRGTRLIQIDPRTYELEVQRRDVQIKQDQAEIKRLEQEVLNLQARIKIAKSDVALAKSEYFRLKKLIDRKVIAQSTLDKAEQQYLASLERLQTLENQLALTGPQKEQLLAQREMAKVMFAVAKLDLERSAIVAPFDGWVLAKTIEIGQHVTIGQSMGRIYSSGELDIEVRIPVKDFKWLPAGLNADAGIEAELIFENQGARMTWNGQVSRVKAEMDDKTRTLPVIIEVESATNSEKNRNALRLRPGMFVTARIKGKEVNQAFVLPRHVVYPGDMVYTVEGDRLRIKSVDILRTFKDSVIVSQGLSDGERVIKTPLSDATDGMLVRVK